MTLVRLQRLLQYSINKSKQTLGFVGPEWEQRTVAELDSALNKWIDTIPEHRMIFPSSVCHERALIVFWT